MSERNVVEKVNKPNTRESLVEDFYKLGLEEGMVILVHSSLSSLGWVCGGPVTVVQALMDVITSKGVIVMPTHSSDYSDPSNWEAPPVPKEWVHTIKETMPAYDRRITPTRGMGRIVETFRTYPNVIRSSHPSVSFAAWGKNAENVINPHSLDFGMGEESPLARIYQLNGHVLLIGVSYDRNTSFHLAEYRLTKTKIEKQGAPIIENGKRVWKEYRDIELHSDPFTKIGKKYEHTGQVRNGRIGAAPSKLFNQRNAVDFAQNFLEEMK